MKYKLIRSERKSIGLQVTEDLVLVVKAPRQATKMEIESLLTQKKDWIQKAIDKRKSAASRLLLQPEPWQMPYLGKQLPTWTQEGIAKAVWTKTGVALPATNPKVAMEEFYRHRAGVVLSVRVAELARHVGCEYASMQINGAKTRWGSCNAETRGLNFSWRLMLADKTLVDYVIIHELMHLRHPDHSPQFWAAVEKVLPEYERLRKELKTAPRW